MIRGKQKCRVRRFLPEMSPLAISSLPSAAGDDAKSKERDGRVFPVRLFCFSLFQPHRAESMGTICFFRDIPVWGILLARQIRINGCSGEKEICIK